MSLKCCFVLSSICFYASFVIPSSLVAFEFFSPHICVLISSSISSLLSFSLAFSLPCVNPLNYSSSVHLPAIICWWLVPSNSVMKCSIQSSNDIRPLTSAHILLSFLMYFHASCLVSIFFSSSAYSFSLFDRFVCISFLSWCILLHLFYCF